MKKIFVKVIMTTVVLGIALVSGCSKSDNKTSLTQKENDKQKEKLEEKSDNSIEGTQNKVDDIYKLQELANEVVITDEDVTFKNSREEEITIKRNPQRVVGLINSYTNLWYQAGGTIVGRIDSESELPEEALSDDIKTLGAITDVNMELLISLEPDLVIMRDSKQNDLLPQLEENNIPVILMEYNSFQDYLKYLKVFTALTGNEDMYEKDGTKLLEEITTTINSIPNENNPKVLLMLGTSKSVKAYLSNTANGEMLKHLKAENIADAWEETSATSIEINIEYLMNNDPDFILVQCMGNIEDIKNYIDETYGKSEWWNSLSAVKNDRVVYLDRSLFHFKPNSKYAVAYKELANIIYPDIDVK